MNLKPYPEYKDSGVQWLGDVPRHWEMRKTKYSFKERVQKGFPNEQLLAATQTKGVVPKTHYENRTVVAQKDLHLLKLVKKGDFVISLRSFQGGIELAHYQGIISPAYTIMNPNKEVSVGYFKHLAKSKLFIKLLTTCVTGIREGQNIDYEILKRNSLPIPAQDEQTQIARFLDHKTAQVTRFIKAKKRMIELLKEQKQVIINDAVTGKIDVATGKPYPKYKDSGVEWLGQVPEGWEVVKVKYLLLPNKSAIKVGPFGSDLKGNDFIENGPFCVYNQRTVIDQNFENFKFTITKKTFERLKAFEVFSGDLLLTTRGTIGRTAIVPALSKAGILHPCLMRLQVDERKISVVYLSLFISQCSLFKEQMKILSNATTIDVIYSDTIKNILMINPNLEEQVKIISYIETKTAAIDLTISRTEREIALMQEYRTRLISDVVTGKIDVRDIEIPNIVDIDGTIDESMDEPEGEEELETAEGEE